MSPHILRTLRTLCAFSRFGFLARRWPWLLLMCGSLLQAAEPRDAYRSIEAFQHSAWTAKDGAPPAVTSLAQTADGHLWLGTARGLFRFDGIGFEALRTLGGQDVPLELVSVGQDRSGALIVSMAGTLGRYEPRLDRFTRLVADELASFTRVEGGFDDGVWGLLKSRLVRVRGGRVQTLGPDWGLPADALFELRVDRQRQLWVCTVAGALYRLVPGATRFERVAMQAVLAVQDAQGRLWGSAGSGLKMLPPAGAGTGNAAVQMISKLPHGNLLIDRAEGLWVQSNEGVKHIADLSRLAQDPSLVDRTEPKTLGQGLSSDQIWTLFEDRDGNVWLGTANGIDRFRRPRLTPVKMPRRQMPFAMAPGDGAAIWAGNWGSVLFRVDPSSIYNHPLHVANISVMHRAREGTVFVGTGGTQVWRSARDHGFFRLLTQATPLGRLTGLTIDADGVMWGAVHAGPIVRSDNITSANSPHWEVASGRDGLPPVKAGSRTVFSDRRGRLWITQDDVLYLRAAGVLKPVPAAELPAVGVVHLFHERGRRLWVGGSTGVAVQEGEQAGFRSLRFAPEHQVEQITGIVETRDGELWLHGANGAHRVRAADWQAALRDGGVVRAVERLGLLDGLFGTAFSHHPMPSVIEADDGRLWFSTSAGLAHVDPRVPAPAAPVVPAVLKALVADGRLYAPGTGVQLPPRVQQLELRYAAPNLSLPERVTYRYRLEGYDPHWQEAGGRRSAHYTNLPPGRYRFIVQAGNEAGVWSEQEAVFDFEALPAWYQTTGFRTLCVLVALLLLWGLYRLRVRQLRARFDMQAQARLVERQRIARELHDTLLQGVQGLVLSFQSAADRLPAGHPSRAPMESALVRADQMLNEGRDRVHGLRETADADGAWVQRLDEIGRGLQLEHGPRFKLQRRGALRPLQGGVQPELESLAREALANAFQHAQARQVTLVLDFADTGVALQVHDDGRGIEAGTLQHGRRGRWGLAGMRERADRIGAELHIGRPRDAGTGTGTEVALLLPARRAYADAGRPGEGEGAAARSWWQRLQARWVRA